MGNFTYTRDNYNVMAALNGWRTDEGSSSFHSSYYSLNGIAEENYSSSGKSPHERRGSLGTRAEAALDYEFNRNHSLSLQLQHIYSKTDAESSYAMTSTNLDSGKSDSFDLKEIADIPALDRYNASLFYRGRIGKWSFSAKASYKHFHSSARNSTFRSTGDNYLDNRNNKSDMLWANINARKPLYDGKLFLSLYDDAYWLEYKSHRVLSKELLSQTKEYRNTLKAALNYYPSSRFSAGIDLGIQTGHVWDTYTSTAYAYPYCGLWTSYAASPRAYFRINYSMNSNTPALSELQDYGTFTDSLIYSHGNPALKACLRQSVTVDCNLFNNLSVRLKYSHLNNASYQMASAGFGTRPDGIEGWFVSYGYANGSSDSWKADVTYGMPLSRIFSLSLQAGFEHIRSSAEGSHRHVNLPQGAAILMAGLMDGSLQAAVAYGVNPTMY